MAAIARLIARHPVKRLSVATGLFRRFPFNPPGYRMEDVPVAGAVAFDVYRCPVADYFRAHGLGPLCVRTWCALDEPLAGMWGGALERQGTLAGGAVRCDFRWLPLPRKGADGAGGITAGLQHVGPPTGGSNRAGGVPPEQRGEFECARQMGMFRGKVVVEQETRP
jgi:hypothetical protein